MLKENVKAKVMVIDFENKKEDLYGNTEIKDSRFWNDVQNGYYRFVKGTTLVADIDCPWRIEEPLKILKVHEVIYSD